MDDDEKKMLFNEINNLKDLDHPNILKMYEFFEDEKRYYIVTDICKGGELFDEIVQRQVLRARCIDADEVSFELHQLLPFK